MPPPDVVTIANMMVSVVHTDPVYQENTQHLFLTTLCRGDEAQLVRDADVSTTPTQQRRFLHDQPPPNRDALRWRMS